MRATTSSSFIFFLFLFMLLYITKKEGDYMILYHIQRECDFTPLYYPGSEFIVGEDYNRLHKNSFDHDGTYIESTEVRDGKEYNHKRNVIELLDWDKILDMTSVEQLN